MTAFALLLSAAWTFVGIYYASVENACPSRVISVMMTPERACTKQGGWWVPALNRSEEDMCVTSDMLAKLGVKQ